MIRELSAVAFGIEIEADKAEGVAAFISNTMPGFCNSLELRCSAVDMQEATENVGWDIGDAGIFVGDGCKKRG